MKNIALIMVSLIFVFGCRSAGDIKTANMPPEWVLKTPEIKGMICSVGMSDPTFYEEDAKINSAEIARKELAKTISIEIKSIMIDMASEKGDRVDEGVVMQVSAWATNAVVQNAKIMEYWHDTEGTVSQKKNSAYALSCMPRKFNRDELAAKLVNSGRAGGIDIQEVSGTAGDIIKHLEGPNE